MTPVYYNDFEPFACASLRRNIERGRLGAGIVDERSIVDVQPADLADFTICHFFAGIGGFELARLMAGWPDDEQLWTGGFPCQDISCAGKGEGISGERSGLWFEFLRLIRACRPARLLIENVPALRTRGADEVLDGLEREGYAARPIVVGADLLGSPQENQRVWIVALAPAVGRRLPESRGGQVSHAPCRDRETDNAFDAVRHAWPPRPSEVHRIPPATDGISPGLARWRRDSLKAVGNAIVPQVAAEVLIAWRAA